MQSECELCAIYVGEGIFNVCIELCRFIYELNFWLGAESQKCIKDGGFGLRLKLSWTDKTNKLTDGRTDGQTDRQTDNPNTFIRPV